MADKTGGKACSSITDIGGKNNMGDDHGNTISEIIAIARNKNH